MPVHFRCPNCLQNLSVKDEHVGRKIKCPNCQTICQIPTKRQENDSFQKNNDFYQKPSNIESSRSTPNNNPYSVPSSVATINPKLPQKGIYQSTEIVPTSVEPGEVLRIAGKLWQENAALLLGTSFFVIAVGILFGVSQGIIETILENDPSSAAAINLVLDIISRFIDVFLGIGAVTINLRLARGQEATFGTLFSGGSRFWTVFVACLLAGLIFVLGFLFLIIPGIIAVFYLWGFYYVVIDEKGGIAESLSVASSFCKINIFSTFILGLASLGIAFAGLLACLIGIWPATSFISVMWTIAYLKMTGQKCVE